jgi:hypothetical protein
VNENGKKKEKKLVNVGAKLSFKGLGKSTIGITIEELSNYFEME